jgi:hypothetical protein
MHLKIETSTLEASKYIYISFWELGGDGPFIPNDGSWKKVKNRLNLENHTLLIKLKNE